MLNRAVAWKLIDENPAKRGVPHPGRRCIVSAGVILLGGVMREYRLAA